MVSVAAAGGSRIVRVFCPPPFRDGPLFAAQEIAFLPDRVAGARYELSEWLRTSGAMRPVWVSIRLDYANGGYEFFDSQSAHNAVAIPTGNPFFGWQRLEVTARAALPVTSIEAFVLNSSPGVKSRGTIELRDPRLVVSARPGVE